MRNQQFQRIETAMYQIATQHKKPLPNIPPHMALPICRVKNRLAIKFVKDPISFHLNINTKHPVLAYNFWEGEIDHTLRQAFD